MLRSYLICLVVFFAAAGLTSEVHAQVVTVADSLDIPDNSFRQNLIHLSGDHYISSGYTSTNSSGTGIESQLVLRLYEINNDDITLVQSQNIGSAVPLTTGFSDRLDPSLHTSVAQSSDTGIALAYTNSDGLVVQRFSIDSTSTVPFTQTGSVIISTASNQQFPSLIKFDETRLVLVYTTGSPQYTGDLRVIRLDADGGLDVIDESSTRLPSPNQYRYNSMAKIDDDTVAIGHRGGSADGTLLAVDIDSSDTVTPGTPDRFTDSALRTSYHSLVRVDDDTLAIAYSHFGRAGSTSLINGDAYISLVDLNDQTFTVLDTVIYYNDGAIRGFAEHAHFGSLALLDSDTLVVAYRGPLAAGYLRVYDIVGEGSDAALQAVGGSFEHDRTAGSFNSLVRVNDDALALVYAGDYPASIDPDNGIPSIIKTFSVPVPTVSSVSASGGPYNAGESFQITVTFSKPVTVTGTPTLTLETGAVDAVVNYASGSPGTELVFIYTVLSGHDTINLNYTDTHRFVPVIDQQIILY